MQWYNESLHLSTWKHEVTCYSAGVVVTLARKYRVSLPVLTAVAQVLNGHLNAKEAVYEIMNLPQIEER